MTQRHATRSRHSGLHGLVAFHYPNKADILTDTNRDPIGNALTVGHAVCAVDTGECYVVVALLPGVQIRPLTAPGVLTVEQTSAVAETSVTPQPIVEGEDTFQIAAPTTGDYVVMACLDANNDTPGQSTLIHAFVDSTDKGHQTVSSQQTIPASIIKPIGRVTAGQVVSIRVAVSGGSSTGNVGRRSMTLVSVA